MWREDSGKWIKLISLCVVILLFGIFLGKNYTPTPVWLFLWTPNVPLIFIALVCFIVGGLCGWIMTAFVFKRIAD